MRQNTLLRRLGDVSDSLLSTTAFKVSLINAVFLATFDESSGIPAKLMAIRSSRGSWIFLMRVLCEQEARANPVPPFMTWAQPLHVPSGGANRIENGFVSAQAGGDSSLDYYR
jgi:hypothetical protein